MKKGMIVLAAWAFLAAMVLPVCFSAEGDPFAPEGGGDKKAKKQGKKKKREGGNIPFGKDGKASAAFGSDIEQLASQVGLKDDQKKKLEELKAKRDKAVEAFDQKFQPRVTKAEAALQKLQGSGQRDMQARDTHNQLTNFIKSVETNRDRLTEGYERKMFALLTPEQRAKWNAPILTEELTKEFSLVFLEGKQQEKLQALCEAQAKRLSIPLDPEKHAKYLEPIKLQAYRSVLNKQQQGEYRKMKAAEAAKTTNKGKKKAG